MAAELAERYGYADITTATRAALLHDVGKVIIPQEIKEIEDWQSWDPDEEEWKAGMSLLHAPVGAWLATQLGVPREGAAAIRYHVTGRPEMTLLDKIIMAADAAEHTRTYPWAEEMRYILSSSLDLAVAFWVNIKEGFVRLGGGVVHPRSSLTLQSLDAVLNHEAALLAKPYLG